MAWNPTVFKKKDKLIGNFSISLRLVDHSMGRGQLLTGVYGISTTQNRQQFWEELYDVRGFWDGPWVVGGDFKVIRFVHKKNSQT